MTTFFTADSHFGHAGIIGMCVRPYFDIEEHDRGLIDNWNAVVAPGASREAWRREFSSLMRHVDAFAPDLILVSAGFDAHARDPVSDSSQNLEAEDFEWATRAILEVARTHGRGRVVSSLEGGYDLEALGQSALAHVRALSQG